MIGCDLGSTPMTYPVEITSVNQDPRRMGFLAGAWVMESHDRVRRAADPPTLTPPAVQGATAWCTTHRRADPPAVWHVAFDGTSGISMSGMSGGSRCVPGETLQTLRGRPGDSGRLRT